MNGMTDIHQHVLWGIDDGPQRVQEMHAMLREASAQGVRRVFATPHACPGMRPFDRALYDERLWQANAFCREEGLDVELFCGAEIEWTFGAAQAIRRHGLPTLGGTDCLLIELWGNASWRDVRAAATQVLDAGMMPVLAHVERYRCFVLEPRKAIALRKELCVAYQMNAQTALGGGGIMTRRFARRMLEAQAIDAVASDAHNCTTRPQLLGKAYAALRDAYGAAYADALVNYSEVLP